MRSYNIAFIATVLITCKLYYHWYKTKNNDNNNEEHKKNNNKHNDVVFGKFGIE